MKQIVGQEWVICGLQIVVWKTVSDLFRASMKAQSPNLATNTTYWLFCWHRSLLPPFITRFFIVVRVRSSFQSQNDLVNARKSTSRCCSFGLFWSHKTEHAQILSSLGKSGWVKRVSREEDGNMRREEISRRGDYRIWRMFSLWGKRGLSDMEVEVATK